MIVMAVIGEDSSRADKFYVALRRDLGASRVRKVYVGFISDMDERLRRLRLESSGRWSDDIVTMVVGINTAEEIDQLRQMGAFICHEHGPMPTICKDLPIQRGDLFLSVRSNRPSHVLDPLEAYSVCCIQRVKQRQAKGAA